MKAFKPTPDEEAKKEAPKLKRISNKCREVFLGFGFPL